MFGGEPSNEKYQPNAVVLLVHTRSVFCRSAMGGVGGVRAEKRANKKGGFVVDVCCFFLEVRWEMVVATAQPKVSTKGGGGGDRAAKSVNQNGGPF